jgi:serine/threonine-protein kinase
VPSSAGYSNLGTVYYTLGRYDEACVAYEKATALAPSDYLVWANLGDAYRWMPDAWERSIEAYTKAIELARAALKRGTEDLEARSRLAVLLAKRGDAVAARHEIQRVESSTSEKTGALHYRTAITYELIGDRAKALNSLERAVNANYPVDEIRRDPELKALRSDTRYARLTASVARK